MFPDLLEAFTPYGNAHPIVSAAMVFGLIPGALAWVFVALRRRASEVGRELARYESPRRGLRLVEASVQVEGGPAATLHVDEVDSSNDGIVLTDEVGAQTSARPFLLCDVGGATVRVEPGDAPYVDRGAMTEDAAMPRPGGRTRVFHLEAGARVFVFGQATGAGGAGRADYRVADAPPVLGPPDDGPLEIHAASPVPRLHAERLRARSWQLLCPLALALIEAVALHSYLAQVVAGRVIAATLNHVSTLDAGDDAVSACATPVDADEAQRWGEVCSSVSRVDAARFRRGAPAHAIVVDAWPEANALGERPSAPWLAAFGALCAVAVFAANAPRGPVAPWRARRR